MRRWLVFSLSMLGLALLALRAGNVGVGAARANVVARPLSPPPLPTVSLEIPVDEGVPAPGGGADAPMVAASQSGYLVVWVGAVADSVAVLAMRLDGTGAPIDPTAIVVYTFAGQDTGSAVVASDGTDYFVVWTRQTPPGGSPDMLATRVRASDGALLDASPDPLLLAQGVEAFSRPACVGGTYVVAFSTADTSNAYVRSLRVRAAALLDPPGGVLLATIPQASAVDFPYPDVAAGPADQVFVAWQGDGVREQVSTGTVLDASPVQFAKLVAGRAPRAGFDGSNYYMAWNSGGTLWGARVRASDGAALDADDLVHMVPGSKLLRQGLPQVSGLSLVRVDSDLAVVYGVANTISSFSIDPATGTPATAQDAGSDTQLATNVGAAFDVAVGSAGGELAFTYLDATFQAGGVAGRRLAHAQGHLSVATAPPVRVSLLTQTALTPVVASNGADYLVAWYDTRRASTGVYASRVSSAQRASLDPQGLAIVTTSNPFAQQGLASSGNEYLCVWVYGPTVFARTIGSDGALGTPFSVRTAPASSSSVDWPTRADVLYDSAHYLVAWIEGQSVLAARVDGAGGAVVDTTPLVLITTPVEVSPSPAFDLSLAVDKPADPARTVFVVWSRILSTPTGQVREIVGVRVRPATGAVVDATTPVSVHTGAAFNGSGPLVASDGTSFLVVWGETGGDAGAPEALYGTRVDPASAALLDKTGSEVGVLLADSPLVESLQALVWDGKSYAALWSSGTSQTARRVDLVLGRFTSALAPLDPVHGAPGFVLQSQAVGDGMGMASAGGGRLLAAYPSYVTTTGQIGQRVHARLVTDDGLPGDGGAVFEPGDASADAPAEASADDGGGVGGDAGAGSDAGAGDDASAGDAGASHDAAAGNDAAVGSNDGAAGSKDGAAAEAGVDAAANDAGAGGPGAMAGNGSGASAGCSCRTGGGVDVPPAGWMVALGCALLLRRRRAMTPSSRTIV